MQITNASDIILEILINLSFAIANIYGKVLLLSLSISLSKTIKFFVRAATDKLTSRYYLNTIPVQLYQAKLISMIER